jgi:2-phospho-L-lactate guanylyltransferase (CobY/MobA/RfbA family)
VTHRVVAVWARAASPARHGLAVAMLEDVVDLVTGMQQVSCALLAAPSAVADAGAVSWPGTPVVTVPEDAAVDAALSAVAGIGAGEAAVVVGDAPDLPPLLLGKLFSALTTAQVAVCRGGEPAAGARLVDRGGRRQRAARGAREVAGRRPGAGAQRRRRVAPGR